jgi:hypothetical protein
LLNAILYFVLGAALLYWDDFYIIVYLPNKDWNIPGFALCVIGFVVSLIDRFNNTKK